MRERTEYSDTYRRGGSGGGERSGGGGRGRGGERGDKRGGFKRAPRSTKFYILKEGDKVDYKNLALLQKYISDRGKVLSRRYTGVSAKNQRKIIRAIKRARYLGLVSVGGVR